MKVKNGELFGLVDDLGHLVTEDIYLKDKNKAYLLLEHVKPFIDSFNKTKDEFVKKYGTGSKSKGYSISPQKWEKLSEDAKKEWKDLNEQEHEIESKLEMEIVEGIKSKHEYQWLLLVLRR